MIKIKKSQTADSRTTQNFKDVTKEQLINSTKSHKSDVENCMSFFADNCNISGKTHDNHKLITIDDFHKAFINGFKDETWWNEHKQQRHHLPNNINDLNLIDVLEYISDCCSAGLARSGNISKVSIDKDVLLKCFDNTVNLLKSNMELI